MACKKVTNSEIFVTDVCARHLATSGNLGLQFSVATVFFNVRVFCFVGIKARVSLLESCAQFCD